MPRARQAYSGGKGSGKAATWRYRFVPSTFQFFALRPTIFFASSCKVIVSTESFSCQVMVPSGLKVTVPFSLGSRRSKRPGPGAGDGLPRAPDAPTVFVSALQRRRVVG